MRGSAEIGTREKEEIAMTGKGETGEMTGIEGSRGKGGMTERGRTGREETHEQIEMTATGGMTETGGRTGTDGKTGPREMKESGETSRRRETTRREERGLSLSALWRTLGLSSGRFLRWT